MNRIRLGFMALLLIAVAQTAWAKAKVINGCSILPNATCPGVDLSGANLIGAKLAGANLQGANLNGARLNNANLMGANLKFAVLDGAQLQNANLIGANLKQSSMIGANLSGAKLNNAIIQYAVLSSANLTNSKLRAADLYGAKLIAANLTRADLSLANITAADLSDANQKGVKTLGVTTTSPSIPPIEGLTPTPGSFTRTGQSQTYDAGFKCAVPQWSIADFNIDGMKDFVIGFSPTTDFTARSDPVSPYIWISNKVGQVADMTTGYFLGKVTQFVGVTGLITKDFNGDKIPDMIFADQGLDTYENGVPTGPSLGAHPELALSNGNKFEDASDQFNVISPGFLHTAAVGDVNGDGNLDIYMGSITSHIAEKAPYMLINDGAGNFKWTQSQLPDLLRNPYKDPTNFSHPAPNVTVVSSTTFTGSNIFDFDKDGDNDLFALASDSSSYSYALRNDGRGNFNTIPPIRLPAGFYGSGGVTFTTTADGSTKISGVPGSISLASQAADINGDTWPDLLIIQTYNDPARGIYYRGGKIQILINNQGNSFSDETMARGNPGFEASSNYDSYHGPLSVFDVNRDGHKDILATRVSYPYETHIFLNNGLGNFLRSSVPGLPTDGILVPISDDLNQATRLAFFKLKNRLEPWDGGTVGACTHTVQVYSRSN